MAAAKAKPEYFIVAGDKPTYSRKGSTNYYLLVEEGYATEEAALKGLVENDDAYTELIDIAIVKVVKRGKVTRKFEGFE